MITRGGHCPRALSNAIDHGCRLSRRLLGRVKSMPKARERGHRYPQINNAPATVSGDRSYMCQACFLRPIRSCLPCRSISRRCETSGHRLLASPSETDIRLANSRLETGRPAFSIAFTRPDPERSWRFGAVRRASCVNKQDRWSLHRVLAKLAQLTHGFDKRAPLDGSSRALSCAGSQYPSKGYQ